MLPEDIPLYYSFQANFKQNFLGPRIEKMDATKEINRLKKDASEIHSFMGQIYTQKEKLKKTNPGNTDQIDHLEAEFAELRETHKRLQREIISLEQKQKMKQ